MRKHKEHPWIKNYVNITADDLVRIVLNAAREEHKEVPRYPTAKVNFHKDIAGHIKATISWEERPEGASLGEGYVGSKRYMQ